MGKYYNKLFHCIHQIVFEDRGGGESRSIKNIWKHYIIAATNNVLKEFCDNYLYPVW